VGKTRLAREAVFGARGARRRWIIGTASARSIPLSAFADVAASFGPDPLQRVREVIDGLIGDGRHPVIVGVDDAHLLDDLSAFVVHQLVTRRLATVVLTIRSGESPPDTITGIWKDQHLKRLELQPLSLTEITRLVEHVLDGPVHSLAAHRLWRYTQGNVLYLRHLIESEVEAGRITRHSGVWLWDGHPTLSPTLAELLEARIAQAPKPVRDVLDALAVAEPMDTDPLASVTDPDAVAESESLGLVRIDTGTQPATAWLAHPLVGEVRRTGSLQLRRLRGRIATELARKATDPRDLVRRAALSLDSDLTPDPALLVAAARAAMLLLDLRLAESLAERAVAAGGDLEAKLTRAVAMIWLERETEAETVLAELADHAAGPLRAHIAIPRVLNLAMILGQPANAEKVLDEAQLGDDEESRVIADALRVAIDTARGHARAAVDRASDLVAHPPANPVAHMLAILAMVDGLGGLGRIDDIEAVASSGYRLAEQSAEVSQARFPLAIMHANAYSLCGDLDRSDATIARIRRDTVDVPFEHSWNTFLDGRAALSRGALTKAPRISREMLALLDTGGGRQLAAAFGRSFLATAMGMAGQSAEARREFTAIPRSNRDPDANQWASVWSIAEAWVCAAEGACSQATSIARDAAARERRLGRPAWEVMLLQIATQFGDHTTAGRLAELATIVQGPRAPTAAAHAAALAADDGDALIDAARRYEQFGDLIAGADAAAQAVVAHRDANRRGAALTASAMARRLADDCGGADTPALRAATMPLPITTRQREIIALAAQGLSNKQIADRLTMSVRSVQSHIFRASQRVGVNSRDELIAMLQGAPT